MKTFALAVGLLVCAGAAARAADPDLSGKYEVVSGKKNGANIDEKAKKAKYTVTADTFTITGGETKFVIGYKITDLKSTPMALDMAVSEGPDGTKNTVAVGIFELKGDTLKIAYSLDREKRPKDFEGKTGYMIELKKVK
jgi:uncharacterized protein (TIGR03067 family)